jgi:C-terminal processing protease CtpA/Prc
LLRVKEVRDIVENLSNTKSIIIDIRNYPLGTKDAIVAELSEKEQECFKSIMPDLSKPGRFVWRKARKKAGRKNKDPYKGKIILLVNEETISYAELTCMCLQTLDNVTVIGSQTAGADGNVTELKFIGGFDTNISGIGMFYPNGKETQRIGIEPDITIEQTISGIKNGRDEILEKAIEVANE